LNTDGVPAFRYEWRGLTVSDELSPLVASPDSGLSRTIRISTAKSPENTYLRIAAGNAVEEMDGAFVVDGVRYEVQDVQPVIRSVNGRTELLLPVQVKDGSAILVVRMWW
jgi:hypothetical protein